MSQDWEMIVARLDEPATYGPVMNHCVWKQAFEGVQGLAAHAPMGITEWKGPLFYRNVHGYETNAERDVQDYDGPSSTADVSRLRMVAGSFAIFLPADGHRPQLSEGVHPGVHKVVVKIDTSLLLDWL